MRCLWLSSPDCNNLHNVGNACPNLHTLYLPSVDARNLALAKAFGAHPKIHSVYRLSTFGFFEQSDVSNLQSRDALEMISMLPALRNISIRIKLDPAQ